MLGLSTILGPISNLAGTWLQGKMDTAKAETDVKVAEEQADKMKEQAVGYTQSEEFADKMAQ